MCFPNHYLDRPREDAAQQRHSPTTLSLRSRLDERRAALMAWLRPFRKPTGPVTAAFLEQAEPAVAKPMPLPIDQACTVASTASEREAEAA